MALGHYTSFCKNNRNNQWYLYDDQFVTPEPNLNNIVNENAYLLFYQRKTK
jgi:ubiquitin C-terminal hydrolase